MSKFRKRKRKLLSCVSVRDKTWNWALSRRSRATTAKKCKKKAWCTCKVVVFANLNLFFFCRSRCCRRRRCLSSLLANCPPPTLLSNTPTSLCESFLGPVSYSFLKWWMWIKGESITPKYELIFLLSIARFAGHQSLCLLNWVLTKNHRRL